VRAISFLSTGALVLVLTQAGFSQTRPARPSAAVVSDARSAIKLGNRMYSQAHYDDAIEQYRRVPPSAGDRYSEALFNIGVCYYELWRTEDAIAMYRAASSARDGKYPKALYALGVALEDLDNTTEARIAYTQSIDASNGEYAPAYYRLGLLLANAGDPEPAEKLFRSAILHFKEPFPAAHNNLGVMLARMKRFTEAEQEFAIALSESNGSQRDASFNLALCRSLLKGPSAPLFAALKITDVGNGNMPNLRNYGDKY
jgi:tetratricopeptide (TPR) repeat protein